MGPTMNLPPQPPAGLDAEDRTRNTCDPATVADDAEVVALVRSAAGALPEKALDALDLHLRHGLSLSEIGADAGLTIDEASRLLARSTRRLGDAVGARILFRSGQPRCPTLRDLLSGEGVAAFGPVAAAMIAAHAGSCGACGEGRRTRLAPTAMFAAIPLARAPLELKAQVAVALEARGVPLAGSSATAGLGGGAGHLAAGGWYGAGPAPIVASRLSRRWTKALAAAAASITLLAGAVAVAANRAGDAGGDVAAFGTGAPAMPAVQDGLAVPEPELEAPVPDEPSEAAPDDEAQGEKAPGTKGPGEKAPGETKSGQGGRRNGTNTPAGGDDAARPALVRFELSAGSATSGTSVKAMPKLTWEAKGPGGVEVRGPGVSSVSLRGSEAVCPGRMSEGRCWCEGSFEYTITLYDAEGQVVKTTSRTLTMDEAPG